MQQLIKDRLAGVDWLLVINGAEIVKASPSFDTCQGVALFCNFSSCCFSFLFSSKSLFWLSFHVVILSELTISGRRRRHAAEALV
jgi:hypothetical protein